MRGARISRRTIVQLVFSGLFPAFAAGAVAAEDPLLSLALSDDGRIRLALAAASSPSPHVRESRPSALRTGGLSFTPAEPQPVLCALSLGSVLCGDAAAETLSEGGVALAWNGDGWRLTLDYRRLLASPAAIHRTPEVARLRLVDGERLAVSGEFGAWGLSLAFDRWESPSSGLDVPIGAGSLYGLEGDHSGLSLDLRHAGLTGRVGARRSEEAEGNVPRIADAVDVGLLLRTPWRAELEMGALNLWHENRSGSRAQSSLPRIGRTPYVRYRQDF